MATQHDTQKAVDSMQQRLTSYACDLTYDRLSQDAIHAAKVRIIDTLGALVAGFFGDPSRICRDLAAQMPDVSGVTIVGTRMKSLPDIAAFANATTARYPELTDSYHWPGSHHGHASDMIMPILAAGEYVHASGRDLITAVVLGYEVFLRISDAFRNPGFDNTMFGCIGTAVAAGKLLALSPGQMAHCISMAVVPNAVLKQIRRGDRSMFKAAAAGQAGRAGVFAALLAREGMEGPHLPFEGKAGWCDHVALNRFTLDKMGSGAEPFKILLTQIKTRPASGETSSAIFAAEAIAPLGNIKDARKIVVETFKYALDIAGTGEHRWHPDRASADGSIPYCVGVALMDGTVTPRSYNNAHLTNPELQALMQKIEVVENPDFSKAFERIPIEHRTRVTVTMASGQKIVGDAGADENDLSTPKSDAQIEAKLRSLTEDVLGTQRVTAILKQLWALDRMADVAAIPASFVFA
jgi:2-methylcitrate dehydratase